MQSQEDYLTPVSANAALAAVATATSDDEAWFHIREVFLRCVNMRQRAQIINHVAQELLHIDDNLTWFRKVAELAITLNRNGRVDQD